MKNIRRWGAWLGAGAVVFALAGCADKNNNGQAESVAEDPVAAVADNIKDTGSVVVKGAEGVVKGAEGAVDATGKAIEGAGDAIAKGADKAGDVVAKGADKAAAVAAGAGTTLTLTPKIKTALLASDALKTAKINVDTLPDKTTIALRGSVKSASQKTLAEQIAKKAAPGMTIANQLVVAKS